MLKAITTSILLSCSLSSAQEPVTLSETDRQLLLDRLKEIQESTTESASDRFSNALNAFRAASASDGLAHELFVKCTEKVLFQDEAKKNFEFREWRRRHKDRRDSPAFRRALRHQLAWLALTLEMSKNPEKIKTAAPKAIAALEAVLRDHEKLKGAQSILNDAVMGSIFARAYSVDNLKAANWPNAPLDIAGIYDTVVLPPLREMNRLDSLRDAWKKRISYEGTLIKKWSAEGSIKGRRPAFEKWYYKERLNLMWAMEMDIFRVGDQRNAALRMLDFLKKNLHHPNASKWINDFTSLISGKNVKVPGLDVLTKKAEKAEEEKAAAE